MFCQVRCVRVVVEPVELVDQRAADRARAAVAGEVGVGEQAERAGDRAVERAAAAAVVDGVVDELVERGQGLAVQRPVARGAGRQRAVALAREGVEPRLDAAADGLGQPHRLGSSTSLPAVRRACRSSCARRTSESA